MTEKIDQGRNEPTLREILEQMNSHNAQNAERFEKQSKEIDGLKAQNIEQFEKQGKDIDGLKAQVADQARELKAHVEKEMKKFRKEFRNEFDQQVDHLRMRLIDDDAAGYSGNRVGNDYRPSPARLVSVGEKSIDRIQFNKRRPGL